MINIITTEKYCALEKLKFEHKVYCQLQITNAGSPVILLPKTFRKHRA